MLIHKCCMKIQWCPMFVVVSALIIKDQDRRENSVVLIIKNELTKWMLKGRNT